LGELRGSGGADGKNSAALICQKIQKGKRSANRPIKDKGRVDCIFLELQSR